MRRLPALLTALALTVAACGGSSGDGGDGDVSTDGTAPSADSFALLSAVTDNVADAGTARLEMTLESAVGSMTATGEFDFVAQRGRITFDLAELVGEAAPPGVDTTMDAVFDGTIMYLRSPLLTAELPGATSDWVMMDLAKLSELAAGVDVSQLMSQANADPRQALQMMVDAAEFVKELGAEEVRGVDTTHLRVTVNLRTAYEQAGAVVDPATLNELIAQVGERQEWEVWVDGDGLPRRMRLTIPARTSTAGTMTMDLFDYGTAVAIDVPTDAFDLVQLLESELTAA